MKTEPDESFGFDAKMSYMSHCELMIYIFVDQDCDLFIPESFFCTQKGEQLKKSI